MATKKKPSTDDVIDVGGSAPAPETKAVAKRESAPMAMQLRQAPETFLDRLLQMASTPGIDVGVIDKLIDANERVMAIQAKREFDIAFAKMQAMFTPVAKTGRGQSRSFSTLEGIMDMAREPMRKHGFSLRYTTHNHADGDIETTGVLSHIGGHSEQDSFRSAPDQGGNKNDIQERGSARSYHRRYIAKSLLGIVDAEDTRLDELSEEQDQRRSPERRQAPPRRQGQQKEAPAKFDTRPISAGTKDKPGQRERLWAIVKSAGRDKNEVRDWIMARYGYTSSAEIQRGNYDEIIAAIQSEGKLPMPERSRQDEGHEMGEPTFERDPGEEG